MACHSHTLRHFVIACVPLQSTAAEHSPQCDLPVNEDATPKPPKRARIDRFDEATDSSPLDSSPSSRARPRVLAFRLSVRALFSTRRDVHAGQLPSESFGMLMGGYLPHTAHVQVRSR